MMKTCRSLLILLLVVAGILVLFRWREAQNREAEQTYANTTIVTTGISVATDRTG